MFKSFLTSVFSYSFSTAEIFMFFICLLVIDSKPFFVEASGLGGYYLGLFSLATFFGIINWQARKELGLQKGD